MGVNWIGGASGGTLCFEPIVLRCPPTASQQMFPFSKNPFDVCVALFLTVSAGVGEQRVQISKAQIVNRFQNTTSPQNLFFSAFSPLCDFYLVGGALPKIGTLVSHFPFVVNCGSVCRLLFLGEPGGSE